MIDRYGSLFLPEAFPLYYTWTYNDTNPYVLFTFIYLALDNSIFCSLGDVKCSRKSVFPCEPLSIYMCS